MHLYLEALSGRILSLPGVTDFGGAPTAQGDLSSSRSLFWNSFQGGDDAVLTRGRHALKFGVEVETNAGQPSHRLGMSTERSASIP